MCPPLRCLLVARAPALALLSALTLFVSLASPVSAHSELVSASPGSGDVVEGPPSELVAQFTQNLDAARSSLEVRSSTGTSLAKGGELSATKRELRLALPPLPPGEYQVRYVTFSTEDQEIHRDTYRFTVVAQPTAAPSSSTVPSSPSAPRPTQTAGATDPGVDGPSPSPRPTGAPGGAAAAELVPIAAALLVAGMLGVWILRRRST